MLWYSYSEGFGEAHATDENDIRWFCFEGFSNPRHMHMHMHMNGPCDDPDHVIGPFVHPNQRTQPTKPTKKIPKLSAFATCSP